MFCNIIKDDCLNVLKDIKSESIDLILTDPPYNIKPFVKSSLSFKSRKIAMNHLEEWDNNHINPLDWLPEAKRVLKKTGNLIIFCGENQIGDYCKFGNDNFDTFCTGVWHKTNPTPCIRKVTFLKSIEFISFMWHKGHTWNFTKQNEMHNFFETPIVGGHERKIKVQKPIKLLNKLILLASNEGDVVLDMFMGSGSTGVSCKQLNRSFMGIEKDDTNFEIARSRLNE